MTLRDGYRQQYGEDLNRVRFVTSARIFDFEHGGLTTEGAPRVPTTELDLKRLTA